MSTAAREDVQAEPELECLDDDEQLDGADAPSSCMGIYLREVHARLKAESASRLNGRAALQPWLLPLL